MFGNPYYPQNQQSYLQSLQNIVNDAQGKINQIQQSQNQQPQVQPITQNFQLAPTQNTTNNQNFKYVESEEDVKKELVFTDTVFVNKEFTLIWLKNALGETKKYKCEEIVELDEKSLKIANLEQKIKEMEKMLNAKSDDTDVIKPSKTSKP